MSTTSNTLEQDFSPESNIKSTMLIGFTYSLLLNAFLYIGQLLIARTLERTDYATFLVATSFVALCAIISDLGLTPLLVRLFTEADHQRDRRSELGKLFGTMLFVRSAMSLVVVGIVIFIAPQLGYSEQTVDMMVIFLAALVISSRLLVLRSVGEAYLRGKGSYRQYISYAALDAACFALGILLVRYVAKDLQSIIIVYTFCNLPGFVLLCRKIYRELHGEKIRLKVDPRILRTIMAQGLPLILGSIFMTIHYTSGALFLDKLSTPYEVSAYGAAVRIQSALLFIPGVFALVIAPEVTRLLVRREEARAQKLVTRSATILMVISSGIALVLTAIPAFTMTVFFGGEKYLDAAGLMLLLTWTYVGASFAYFTIEMGIAEGNQWLTTIYMLTIMIVSVVLDLVLIPEYGSRGTGLSRLIAISCGVVALWFRRKSLNMLDHRLFARNIFRLGCIVVVSYGLIVGLRETGFHEIVIGLIVPLLFFLMIQKAGLLSYKEVQQIVDTFRLKLSGKRQ